MSLVEDIYSGTEDRLKAVDGASVVVTLICYDEHQVLNDMADLLRRLIGVSIAKSGEGELVAIVWNETRQIVKLAEGVLDNTSTAWALAGLHFFTVGAGVALVHLLL